MTWIDSIRFCLIEACLHVTSVIILNNYAVRSTSPSKETLQNEMSRVERVKKREREAKEHHGIRYKSKDATLEVDPTAMPSESEMSCPAKSFPSL